MRVCPSIVALQRLIVLHRTDRAVLAVNGFAADGNMFVKKVQQRLEVGLLFLIQSKLFLICLLSGTDTRMQKTCLWVRSRD